MDPTVELNVMMEVSTSLNKLDGDTDAVRRVIQWVRSRYLPDELEPAPAVTASAPPIATSSASAPAISPEPQPTNAGRSFQSLPDLYSAVSPGSDAERALVVGYWFQVVEGDSDLDGFQINRELRHLGHGISNITTALSSLIGRRPQLVLQTRKSGSTRQARKRYRLTDAGIKVVQQMIFNLERAP